MKKELANLEFDSLRDSREYKALVRSLKRRKGFGLLFVECSPAQGEKLIEGVKGDIPQKNVEVLRLEKAVVRVFDWVAEIVNGRAIDILFIMGLESSFYEYESLKREKGWSSKDIYSYSWKGVPPILDHLNQQRENFRDNFDVCFVFLVPRFVVNYFIQRAMDFFDWRSGLFRLPMDVESLQEESSRICSKEEDKEDYKILSSEEIKKKLLEIQSLIDEDWQTDEQKADLFVEQGLLYDAAEQYEEAIAAYDRVLQINADKYKTWNKKGISLENLGRYEEAIEVYEQAIKIKPDYYQAWEGKGDALRNLGKYQEAIVCYDKAIKIKPDYERVWNCKGITLKHLGWYEKAIACYDRILKIKPDYHYAWYNKGYTLRYLERYEEAIACYDKAIEIKPDYHSAWVNKGDALRFLKRYKEAVACYEEALPCCDKAIEVKPNEPDCWNSRGLALMYLGKDEEAMTAYDKAIEIQHDYNWAWYNKACFYALKGNADMAIKYIKIVMNLVDGKECLDLAKTDIDFDNIRESDRFQELINQQTDLEIIF